MGAWDVDLEELDIVKLDGLWWLRMQNSVHRELDGTRCEIGGYHPGGRASHTLYSQRQTTNTLIDTVTSRILDTITHTWHNAYTLSIPLSG